MLKTSISQQSASSPKLNRKEGGLRTKHVLPKGILPEKPFISVITVVRNGEMTLEKSIISVIGQTYRNLEYIIVDGGSTDNTLNIINKYDNSIAYWVSERDEGIYNAMNKGVRIASGSWILFLGADDYLMHNSVIEEAMRFASSQLMLLYGDTLYSNNYRFKSTLNYRLLLHNTVQHQSAIYNRMLFEKFQYDESFKICSDYELNLIIFLSNQATVYTGSVLSFCSLGGLHANLQNRLTSISELNSIRRRHINRLLNQCMSIVLIIRTYLRLLVSSC